MLGQDNLVVLLTSQSGNDWNMALRIDGLWEVKINISKVMLLLDQSRLRSEPVVR